MLVGMRPEKIDPKQTGESRALDYRHLDSDPTYDKEITAPLDPTPATSEDLRSPLILTAGLLLIGLAVVVLIFTNRNSSDSTTSFQPQVLESVCSFTASTSVNMRAGPDVAYARIWILDDPQARQALAQVIDESNTVWLKIANGWVKRDEVNLNSRTACNALPLDSPPQTFNDDIELPSRIAELNWNEQLGENFATDLNGWLEPNAAIREGSLVLYSANNQAIEVSPRHAASYQALGNAYYTLRVMWIASDLTAEGYLVVRQSEKGAYQVAFRRDGLLSLRWLPTEDEVTVLDERVEAALMGDQFEIGLLHHGTALMVLLNGETHLEVRHDSPPQGFFALGLVGENASLQIDRFEVKAPLSDPSEDG